MATKTQHSPNIIIQYFMWNSLIDNVTTSGQSSVILRPKIHYQVLSYSSETKHTVAMAEDRLWLQCQTVCCVWWQQCMLDSFQAQHTARWWRQSLSVIRQSLIMDQGPLSCLTFFNIENSLKDSRGIQYMGNIAKATPQANPATDALQQSTFCQHRLVAYTAGCRTNL